MYAECDMQYVMHNVRTLIESGALIGSIDNDFRGFMLMSISPTWYSPELIAAEQCLYIYPEDRGGMLAARLVRACEEMAKARSVTRMCVGASTGIDDARVEEFYQRLGYRWENRTLTKRF